MFYDQFGRKIEEQNEQPGTGMMIIHSPNDREETDVSRELTPAKVESIMTAANGGDTADLVRLATEIYEKNWDVRQAIDTRVNAVLGIERSFEPGDDSPAAKKIAEAFEAAMENTGSGELDSFNELLEDMMTALVPGFSISEIIWGDGGSIDGFRFVPQYHFTFRNSFRPLLMTDDSQEIEIPSSKIVLHRYRSQGGDPARGGLIRILAWLHCFQRVNVSDLLSFIERYGMPFVVARVDQKTWKTERNAMTGLIRSFGPNGGGVFGKSTELELLQAANTTGDIYFKLLEYTGAAITKVILGQTATSGDAAGWSNGSAQSQVRQDILEADCERLDGTCRERIAKPWTLWNYGDNAPAPKIVSHSEPPEDTEAYYNALKSRFDSMGVAIRAGMLTPTPEDEDVIREILELPELPGSAKAEWSRGKGIRLPITLQKASEMEPVGKSPEKADNAALSLDTGNEPSITGKAVREAFKQFIRDIAVLSADTVHLDSIDRLADNALSESQKSGAVNSWFGKFQSKLDEIADIADPDEAGDKILALTADTPELLEIFDSEDFRKILEKTVYAAAASGMADKTGALKTDMGDK